MADLPPLLMPATAALLDGWCGPVVTGGWSVALAGVSAHRATGGVTFHHRSDGWRRIDAVALVEAQGLCMDTGAYRTSPIADVSLDLWRAECRDRIRSQIGTRFGLDVTGGVASRCVGGHRGTPTLLVVVVTPDAEAGTWAVDSATVPALAALDPHDDRRLPDGSRWADAAALLAVAMEVLRGD